MAENFYDRLEEILDDARAGHKRSWIVDRLDALYGEQRADVAKELDEARKELDLDVQEARAEWEAEPQTRANKRLAGKYPEAAAVLLAEEEAKTGDAGVVPAGRRDCETCGESVGKVGPGWMHVDGPRRHVAVPQLSDAERIEQIMTMHPALLQPEAIELRNEVERIRYERRLLGVCRSVLDQVANGGLRGWAQARQQAGDLAQRIVDEIGHPVTDEPALGPEYRAEIKQLRADLAKARSDLAGWRAAYELLAVGARRLRWAWMSASRGRREARAKVAAADTERDRLDERRQAVLALIHDAYRLAAADIQAGGRREQLDTLSVPVRALRIAIGELPPDAEEGGRA